MQKQPYELADLITKYLINKLTEDEALQLQALLDQNEDYDEFLESFRHKDLAQEEIDFIARLDVDEAWAKVNKKKSRRFTFKSYSKSISIAATLLIAFLVLWQTSYKRKILVEPKSGTIVKHDLPPASNQAYLILSNGEVIYFDDHEHSYDANDGSIFKSVGGELDFSKESNLRAANISYYTLKVPSSGTFRLKLPDGTAVWLNSKSELRFPEEFSKEERKVYLSGEAYFEVAHNSFKPFKVVLKQSEVEVLGTHFNVKSYHGEVFTTLLEGSVKIIQENEEILLMPGEEAHNNEKGIKVKAVDISKAIAWKENLFYFEGETIYEIMDEISRWYDVEIKYEGNVPQDRYKGTVKRHAKLSEVLEMLHFISGIKFEISERSVRVKT